MGANSSWVRGDDPYCDASAVTPNDGADLPDGRCRGLVASGAGNISCVTMGGTTLTVAVAAGQVLPLRVVRVRSTSTTATGIVALY